MGEASALQNGSGGPTRWSLRLFGDFQLFERASGERLTLPGKRERVLLAYLALSPNGRQPRRKLVTLLWGEAADETTLDNLRTSVFNLRKALGDTERSIVASEDRDIVLDVSAFAVDVLTVGRLAAASAVTELEEAAQLYTGDFLEGLSIESGEFESWRREVSARSKGQVLDVLTRLMTQLAASGESERAIEAGLRILRLEPLHETAARSLMRLYAGSGRRASAVELYRTLSDQLKKDLGAQPEAETRAVYAEITRGGEGKSASVGDIKSPPSTTVARGTSPAVELSLPASSSPPVAFQKANRRSIGWLAGGLAGAVALAMLLFVTFVPSPGPAPTGVPATVIAATPTSAVSLAVLPFANLSSERDQEFFSDGLTEEITSALAKVQDLRIVARTSAFEFKGQNRNIRTIGEQLGATHLIEGSVRRAGDRIRITVQLISADDGTHLWSDDYDRQLTDIFAVQEDIARAIAASLRVPLGLRPGQQLVANRAIDPESYQQFLRGKAALLQAQRAFAEQLALLEPVVAKNPDYAPAWAALARAYGFAAVDSTIASPEGWARTRADYEAKMVAAARRAVELDPDLVEAQVQYTRTISGPRKLALVEDSLTRALAVDPNNPEALEQYSSMILALGRVKEAVALKQRLHDLDPFIPVRNNNFAQALWLDGQTDAAIALLMDSIGRVGRPGIGAESDLARIYASMGRYQDAADTLSPLLTTPRTPPLAQQVRDGVSTAVGFLHSAAGKAANPKTLPRLSAFYWLHLYTDVPERSLEAYDQPALGFSALGFLVHSSYSSVRKTERFKKIVRDQGLVAYWRERGWPAFCRPVGADDFVCD